MAISRAVPKCARCTKPVIDHGYLCHDCSTDLEKALALTADLAVDLEITITRRDRVGDRTGRATETPLPYNAAAAEAAAEIRAILETWSTRIIDARGIATPADQLTRTLIDSTALAVRHFGRPVADALLGKIAAYAHRARAIQLASLGQHAPLSDLAEFLKDQVRWLRHQGRPVDPGGLAFAEAAYMELTYAAGRAARACDAHPSLTSLGPCMTDHCEGTLRAPHGSSSTRCSECGAVYDVSTRMDQLMAIGSDYLFTARELSSVLSTWRRRRVPEGTIASWGSRGLMADRGKSGKAYLYRLGDAVTIAKRLIPEPETGHEADAKRAASQKETRAA